MKSIKDLSLDEAFKQLEDLVSRFESGSVSLEEILQQFKHGVKLSQYIKQRLDQLENQIEEVVARDLQDQDLDSHTPSD